MLSCTREEALPTSPPTTRELTLPGERWGGGRGRDPGLHKGLRAEDWNRVSIFINYL